MASYSQIAEAIRSRITHGDYRMQEFPSGKGLSQELGVNPRTVERAMNHLLAHGILKRTESGRYEVNINSSGTDTYVSLLVPAFPSLYTMKVHQAIDRLASLRGWKLRQASYVHLHDPTVAASLRGFDATFFLPNGRALDERNDEVLPDYLVRQIKESGKPIVVINLDTSMYGIPCFRNNSPFGIRNLLDVLLKHGHKKVACLNAQPMDPVVRERIDQWHLWTQLHGIQGQLIDDQVEVFESVMNKVRKSLAEIIKRGELDATAIFCTTGAAALGAMRALTDMGIEPGRDIAVCSADDQAGEAMLLRPSLTCLTDPDITPYLDICLNWMARGGTDWVGPLCMQPSEMSIFVGESTSFYRPKN